MRPIDGDFIDKELDEILDGSDGMSSLAFIVLRGWIRSIPTLTLDDLRPKGRWKGGTCTNCGQVDFSKPNFCPNCGADMREGETRDEVEIQAGV